MPNEKEPETKAHKTVEAPRARSLPGEAFPDEARQHLAPVRVRPEEEPKEEPTAEPSEFPILAGDPNVERPIHLSVGEAAALITAILGDPGNTTDLESALSRMQVIVERDLDSAALPALDVHGIDDSGWYHPPSRARYVQMLAYETALEERLGLAHRNRERAEKRVDELQAEGSTMLNELRYLRSRLERKEKALRLLMDNGYVEATSDEGRESIRKLGEILSAFDALERDAWGQTVYIAREFVKAMKETPPSMGDEVAEAFAERFRLALAT